MPPKQNPLRLNPLQLRTLTLLQELARHPETSTRDAASGEVTITRFPHAHGDHLHLGDALVSARDASGLGNQAVWVALARKGLARATFPFSITLTAEGLAYETGLGDKILHRSDH
ncbi:MAG: hypothetical protein HY521_11665 [Proteobacteria bacterium]|nr:hypothetical protein [Pseudomonadota bacterium]